MKKKTVAFLLFIFSLAILLTLLAMRRRNSTVFVPESPSKETPIAVNPSSQESEETEAVSRVNDQGLDRSEMLDILPSILGEGDYEIADEFGMHIDEILDMKWNSWDPTCGFTSQKEVSDFVREIPVRGNDSKTKHDISSLQTLLVGILMSNSEGNRLSYLEMLKSCGYSPKPFFVSDNRRILKEFHGFDDGQILADSWGVMRTYISTIEKCPWNELVMTGSELFFFSSNTEDMLKPGEKLARIRRKMCGVNTEFSPPHDFGEAIRKYGSVSLVDATIFIQHTEETGFAIRPYIMRFWFDVDSNQWVTLDMAILEGRYEVLGERPVY